jgi:FkbM family methyltransferase
LDVHSFPTRRSSDLEAHVIAVEPDEANYDALLDNIAPYFGRATAYRTGVWSRSCGLILEKDAFGDGREWARTVREAGPGERPMMQATDIATLLRESGESRISILKIDIEGAEAAVFSGADLSWLDKVDALVIELHGGHCEEVFYRAIKNQPFVVSSCDELTVCVRRTFAS